MIIVCYCVLGLYVIVLGFLFLGWRQSTSQHSQSAANEAFITVIVPVRNEAENIGTLLSDLATQQYKNFEVIVANDHSEDETVAVVNSVASLNVRVVSNDGFGKKHAITTAIDHAKGTIIVTTDGDCSVQPGWLAAINDGFSNEQTRMLIGGVKIGSKGTFFDKLQQIEFSSLIGSAVSTLSLGFPSMCNGANLAYRRQVFVDVNGYNGNIQIASGDDEFLMRKIEEKYKGSIRFLTSKDAVVETRPQPDISSFLHQRLRWASKWRFNSSYKTLALAFFVVMVQICLLYGFPFVMVSRNLILSILLLIKITMEAMLLTRFCNFLQIRWHWPSFICLQLVYPVYVIAVSFLSTAGSYRWKGRNY
jgi:biofilm PGA synthesis N-glycosyltransferase PgaC